MIAFEVLVVAKLVNNYIQCDIFQKWKEREYYANIN